MSVEVLGLQIDYDCATTKLTQYGNWLVLLRENLEETTSLSITGLGDWLVSAPLSDQEHLFANTDYVAFMLYSGKSHLKRCRPLFGL